MFFYIIFIYLINLAVAVGKDGGAVVVQNGTAKATATGLGARAESYTINGNAATSVATAVGGGKATAISDSTRGGPNAAATSTVTAVDGGTATAISNSTLGGSGAATTSVATGTGLGNQATARATVSIYAPVPVADLVKTGKGIVTLIASATMTATATVTAA